MSCGSGVTEDFQQCEQSMKGVQQSASQGPSVDPILAEQVITAMIWEEACAPSQLPAMDVLPIEEICFCDL